MPREIVQTIRVSDTCVVLVKRDGGLRVTNPLNKNCAADLPPNLTVGDLIHIAQAILDFVNWLGK